MGSAFRQHTRNSYTNRSRKEQTNKQTKVKGTGKFHPRTSRERPEGSTGTVLLFL